MSRSLCVCVCVCVCVKARGDCSFCSDIGGIIHHHCLNTFFHNALTRTSFCNHYLHLEPQCFRSHGSKAVLEVKAPTILMYLAGFAFEIKN